MRAIVINAYGGPEVIEIRELPRPSVGPKDVLVRVHASSINAGDLFSLRGSPWLIRFTLGMSRPKNHILGWDLAGVVEETGAEVTRFAPGDTVFASSDHAMAEYACVPEGKLAAVPPGFAPEQAAAIPSAALAALHGLRDHAKLQPGQKILINGASGGVGTFSVQIAKALGAHVTGVCSTRNVDMVRSLGADHVIDYTKEDFTAGSQRYDLVLDNVGSRSFTDCRRVLAPGGRILPNTGHAGMSYVLKAYALAAFNRRHARPFLSVPNADDLTFLAELIEAGKLVPVIDRSYPMEEAREAFRHFEEEHAQGKVVVRVG